MKDKLILAGVVVALVFSVGAFLKPTPVKTVVEKAFGASAGPEHLERQFFNGGLTDGRNCFSTTTTGTLTTKTLADNNCIYIAPVSPQAVLAITLPASSTMMSIIPNIGQCADWFIDASDVAAATTTTITTGVGVNVVGLDATGAGTGADVIDGAEYGRLTLCREKDNDITAFVQEWIHAD